MVRCGVGEIAATVRRVCAERGAQRIVIPPDLDPAWISEHLDTRPDDALSPADLDGFDGVVTASALGIAETGTIALDGGPGQGRRALSLVPDYHVCVVMVSDLVETVPQAIERLHGSVTEGRPVTFISGPSATSDIELQRVEGVHGPRTLDVILAG